MVILSQVIPYHRRSMDGDWCRLEIISCLSREGSEEEEKGRKEKKREREKGGREEGGGGVVLERK